MPLVFVHGIANRAGPDATNAALFRDRMFQELLPAGDRIYNPYWGDLGGMLRWNGLSFPGGDLTPMGGADVWSDLAGDVLDDFAEPPEPRRVLCAVADRSLSEAVDLLFTASLAEVRRLPIEDLASAALALAETGAATPEAERWWTAMRDDDEFVAELLERSSADATHDPAWQAMGAGASVTAVLQRGARRLNRAAAQLVVAPAVGGGRRWLRRPLPLLIGDVIAYFAERGDPGAIGGRVIDALRAAVAENTEGHPLVLVAHSMGGAISYDVLTAFAPDVPVDLFITVGSQVGLFEELKAFHASRADFPGEGGERVPRPPSVRRWLNVVDRNDPLAFAAEPIFDGAEDYSYPSGAWWAHTAYFRQPNFFARLAQRLEAAA